MMGRYGTYIQIINPAGQISTIDCTYNTYSLYTKQYGNTGHTYLLQQRLV